MLKTSQVIENGYIPAPLVRAVIRQLGGKESLPDICRGGIDGGFHGFIYYTDTVAFFKRNRAHIRQLVERTAEDFGDRPMQVVAGFNCLRDMDPAEREAAIARCLYGGRTTDADTQVANALAWFAGEEVARAFCE
jgi:hypothetical protein